MLALKDKRRRGEGLDLLREFLEQFGVSHYHDANRRETLELRLFAAELLIASQLSGDGGKVDRKDLAHLDNLLDFFKGRKNTQPFVRRYYELAVRAVRDDPKQMALYLRTARASDRQAGLPTPRTTWVVFHFAAADDIENDNYAIVTKPPAIVRLNLTRQQIKQAADNADQRLLLPEELVTLIEAAEKNGRTLALSWDDTLCFFDKGQGLSESDWKAFSHQVDYKTLRRP